MSLNVTDCFGVEKIEDAKGIIRIRKSKKGRQPKVKWQKDKQRSTKHTHKTKDQITRTPLKTESELRCSRRISSSCSSSGTRRVTISAVCCSYILGVSYIGGANRSTSCTPITFLKLHTNYCIRLYRVHLTTGGNRTRKRFFSPTIGSRPRRPL